MPLPLYKDRSENKVVEAVVGHPSKVIVLLCMFLFTSVVFLLVYLFNFYFFYIYSIWRFTLI